MDNHNFEPIPEHPAWCPIEHSDDPHDYHNALTVISHDVAEIGDAVLDLIMVSSRCGEGDPRHVYVDLNDSTSVGYCGYSVEEIDLLADLLARVAAAMRAVDQGDIREAVPPADVSVSLSFTVMETDPE